MFSFFNKTWFAVDRSPWPVRLSLFLFVFIFFFLYSNSLVNQVSFILIYFFLFIFFSFFFQMVFWGSNVCLEANFFGKQFLFIWINLKLSMKLFIISEIFFFFGFFWSFFWYGVEPHIFIYNLWPPVGLVSLVPWELPWLNTLILVISGVTITYSHNSIYKQKNFIFVRLGLLLTLILSFLFLLNQVKEYFFIDLQINDSVFGSVFFLATGFHCFHVIIGSIFLFLNFYRFIFFPFILRTFGVVFFEASIWYWHFVDVVWLFLFLSIYLWGDYSPFFF
jgi:heme/copper-type cytochrome/quinol oxidase subunit 3